MILGISMYPSKAGLEENLDYLQKAADHGFSRLFLALHGTAGKGAQQLVDELSPITSKAKSLGFEISCDVMPTMVDAIGGNLSPLRGTLNLDFFHELGIDTIRLDLGLSELEEALITQHPQGLKLEFNASVAPHHVGGVMEFGGDRERLSLSCNYYPQSCTGMSLRQFERMGEVVSGYGMKVAAFVTSQNPEGFGPWPLDDGLPTLEMHRHLPIEVQARHLIALGCVEAIYIGNAFATDAELAKLGAMDERVFEFDVRFVDGVPDELRAMFDGQRMVPRTDSNDILLRTLDMKRFAGETTLIEPFNNTGAIKKGDVIVNNRDFGQYTGEKQLARADVAPDPRKNVLGSIVPEQLFLLDYVTNQDPFRLTGV